jgi:hypothetical protein
VAEKRRKNEGAMMRKEEAKEEVALAGKRVERSEVRSQESEY